MLVGKIKNHRNVFRNLIISYLLILLIPFCIGSFVYLEAVKLVKEDALKNNEKFLTQTKDILDIRLNEVEAISGYPMNSTLLIHSFPQSIVGILPDAVGNNKSPASTTPIRLPFLPHCSHNRQRAAPPPAPVPTMITS